MSAVDAAYDEVSEDVAGTFTADTLGVNSVCVRGTDALVTSARRPASMSPLRRCTPSPASSAPSAA